MPSGNIWNYWGNNTMFYEHLMDKKRELVTIYNSIPNSDKSRFDTYMLFTKVKDDFYVQVSDPTKTELRYTYNINNEEIIDIKFLYRLCGAENINLSYDSENYYFYMKLPYIPIFNANVVKVKR